MAASRHYKLNVTASAQRELSRLPEGRAAAIVEFMLGALLDNPQQVGGALRRELAGFHSARRGAYRITYKILDEQGVVVVHHIDHRSTVYRSR